MFCLYLARQIRNIHVTVQSLNRQGLMLGASAALPPGRRSPFDAWPAKVERPTTGRAGAPATTYPLASAGRSRVTPPPAPAHRPCKPARTLRPQAEKPDKPTIPHRDCQKVKPQPLCRTKRDESYRLTVDAASGGRYLRQHPLRRAAPWETLLQLMQNGAENTSLPWSPLKIRRASRGAGSTRRATLFRCRISSARSTAWPRRSSTSCAPGT